MEVGEREIIYLTLHCHHQNDFCIKMGSDESHSNVSAGNDGQGHKAVFTNHNLFQEKGEPNQYRTEVLPLTSLTPFRKAKPAHENPYNHLLKCYHFEEDFWEHSSKHSTQKQHSSTNADK